MKKCIVVSDSFKGSLSSIDICSIANEVFSSVMPECELCAIPVADGGEGTVECFEFLGAEKITTPVSDPWGRKINASYARSGSRAPSCRGE